MKSKQDEVQGVERKKEQADDVLKDKKKEAGKISRELAKLEQDIREVVNSFILYLDLGSHGFCLDRKLK